MVCQYYFVPSSDVQETLAIYDQIRDQNTVSARKRKRVTATFLKMQCFLFVTGLGSDWSGTRYHWLND